MGIDIEREGKFVFSSSTIDEKESAQRSTASRKLALLGAQCALARDAKPERQGLLPLPRT